ncbi:unnamed protein product [Adineta ricciae]|uniref:G-protein coupled receptors family 1 profile domain-containing protein n=1 Tax=Adineta ricciae TaxID=249248 RepID=A0A815MUD6_ADIRI|nr:unnamed protein product [Adineta ricciae]CAF1420860.1 unnamed protein product [Adineta ricciae]
MDYFQQLTSIQTYLYVYGGTFLAVAGSLGCVLNLLIFSKKNLRKSPCSFYFIAYNLANFLEISTCFSQGISAFGFNGYLPTYSTTYCRLMYYVGYVLDVLSPFYLILASIDRSIATSRNARMRRLSNHRLAYMCILIGTIFWMLFHIHALFFFKSIQIMPNYNICYTDSNVYLAFANYYALSKTVCVPILMMICEIHTIRSFRFAHRAAIAPVSTVASTVGGAKRQKDGQLMKILLINVTVYILFNLTPVTVWIYKQVTQYENESPDDVQLDSFLTNVSSLVYYIPPSISCYINLVVSKTFRAEIKKLFLCK